MLSKFLVEFIQRFAAEKYPAFAYWLFYSELAIALLIGLVAITMPPLAAIFFVYAAFNYVGARNYSRKRALDRGNEWNPTMLDRVCAGVVQAGAIGFGVFLIFILGEGEPGILPLIGLAMGGFGIYSLVQLIRGGWPDWP